ncbi:MAG: holo-ACP synthase [Lentisphaerae bacterium]|nr:holo-ACP synthase [Lentisphaerota bacterium]
MNGGSVLGTGIDIVETERMLEVIRRWDGRFRDRVFLSEEQNYCESKAVPSRHYAGRFAVKEAVTKAFGTGIGPTLGWLDIEVVRNPETGAPSAHISPRAWKMAEEKGVGKILVSLSHTRNYAVAHALILARRENP